MNETTKQKKWNDEAVATLKSAVSGESVVSAATVNQVAEKLGVSARSVASKLRQLDIEVASMAKEKVATFSPDEGAALSEFVTSQAGQFTYKEIAEKFMGGKFTAKQVQGKLLALELTGSVKPAEKIEVARTYTEAEEAKFVQMANAGAFIEDIATALSKEVNSVRGKALSLTNMGKISKIPTQKEKHAKVTVDPIDALGDKVATMTVEALAELTDKTPRGIKTLLTRRGLKVANYDGAAKKAKALKDKEKTASATA
jgi:hypothetical protein